MMEKSKTRKVEFVNVSRYERLKETDSKEEISDSNSRVYPLEKWPEDKPTKVLDSAIKASACRLMAMLN